MQIEKRAVLVIYRLVITLLAGVGIWLEYSQLGSYMLRDFSSWFLIAVAGYYFISAIVTLFIHKHSPSYTFWPVFEGILLVSGAILFVGQLVFYTLDYVDLGLGFFGVALIYFVLPVMVLVDWIFFSEKGRWRFSDPLYWLSLPTIYVCWVLATAALMSETARMRYPYDFLNWPEITIPTMFWQFAIMAALIIAFSYICWLIDFAMSGNLAKNIVLPRIKTIVVEDNEDDKKIITEKTEEPKTTIPTKVKVEGLQDTKSAQKIHQPKSAKRIRVDDSETNERLKAAKEISRPKQNVRPEGTTKSTTHNAKSVHTGPKPSSRKSSVDRKAEKPEQQADKDINKSSDAQKAKGTQQSASKPKTEKKTEPKKNNEKKEKRVDTKPDAKKDKKSSSVLDEPKIRIVEQIGEFRDEKPREKKKEEKSSVESKDNNGKDSKPQSKRSSDPV